MNQGTQPKFEKFAARGVDSARSTNQSGAWKGAAILILAYVLAYCDRTIVTILVAPLKKDLNFSDSQIALLIGFSFAVFYSVAGLPLGRVTDTLNRRNLIIVAVVCWSAATAACGLLNSFPALFTARICVGVGEACLMPAALSMIADYFGPRGRARVVAMFVSGAPLGSGLAYLLGGTVLFRLQRGALPDLWPLLTRFPWQFIFVMLGGLGLLVAVLLCTIREPLRRTDIGAKQVRPENKTLAGLFRGNKGLLIGLVFGPAIMSIAFYGFLAWGPTMAARRFGWDSQQIALWFTPLGIVSGILGPWIGAASGAYLIRKGRADGLMRAAVYLGAIAIPLALGATMIPIASVGIILMFVSMGFVIALLTVPVIAIQFVMPNNLRGQVTALFVFFGNIVGFGLGPTIVATLTDHLFHRDSSLNVSLAVVSTAALLIGGAITFMQLPYYRKFVALDLEVPRG